MLDRFANPEPKPLTQALAMDNRPARKKSTQHKGLVTRDLEGDSRERKQEGDRHKTKNEMREGLEIVVE